MKHDHPPTWVFQITSFLIAALGFSTIGPLLAAAWGPGNLGTVAGVAVAALLSLSAVWAAGEALLQLGNRRRRRCPVCTPMRGLVL